MCAVVKLAGHYLPLECALYNAGKCRIQASSCLYAKWPIYLIFRPHVGHFPINLVVLIYQPAVCIYPSTIVFQVEFIGEWLVTTSRRVHPIQDADLYH